MLVPVTSGVCRALGLGFRVQGLGFRVFRGLEFRGVFLVLRFWDVGVWGFLGWGF